MKGIGVIGAIVAGVMLGGGAVSAQEKPRDGQAPTQAATTEAAAASRPLPIPKADKLGGGWWDDVFAEQSTSLTKLVATPDAWRDVPVSFTIHFRQLAKGGPSFFTRFEPDQWLNFAAWPDEAALWEKKAFDADFPHLFIRRDSPDFKTISAAATYDRFIVSGLVRDVIKGQPWIEVTSLKKLPEKITEGSLVHLVKGFTFRDHHRFDAAAREFEAADGETLPIGVRLLGMKEQAFALLNSKKPKAAEERMLTALNLDPENSETALALAHLRDAAKGVPIERLPASRPVGVPQPAEPEDDEPVVPGPPDPLADRPRKKTPQPPVRQTAPPPNPAQRRPQQRPQGPGSPN
jgi:hypothetical protein